MRLEVPPVSRVLSASQSLASRPLPWSSLWQRGLASHERVPLIQRIHDQAAATFQGPPPSRDNLHRLRHLMSHLTLGDVGLPPSAVTAETRAVTFVQVARTPHFDICIFVVPAGVRLGLHDHYGMAVVCKLLTGALEVLAFDPVAEAQPGTAAEDPLAGYGAVRGRPGPGTRRTVWATMCHNGVVDAAHEPLMVWPSRANLHDFRAVTPCAFIDVQAPPYDEAQGRDCRWYSAVEALEVGETVELQETERPYTPFVHATYQGPEIRS